MSKLQGVSESIMSNAIPVIEVKDEAETQGMITETAMFVIRSLVKAHADAGVDITSSAYRAGLETIMVAIAGRGLDN